MDIRITTIDTCKNKQAKKRIQANRRRVAFFFKVSWQFGCLSEFSGLISLFA